MAIKTDPAVPIMLEIGAEIRRACEKHGHYLSPGLQHGMSRLVEEVGEAQREVNILVAWPTPTTPHELGERARATQTKLRSELVQVAAVVHMMLTNLTEGKVEYE